MASYCIRLNPNSLSQPRRPYINCPILTFLTSLSATLLIVYIVSVFFPSHYLYGRPSALTVASELLFNHSILHMTIFFLIFRSPPNITLSEKPLASSFTFFICNSYKCFPLSLQCKVLQFFEGRSHVQFFYISHYSCQDI